MDPNALIAAATAIKTLQSAGLMSARQTKIKIKDLQQKLNDAIGYWGEKGQDDIVDELNNAYRSAK